MKHRVGEGEFEGKGPANMVSLGSDERKGNGPERLSGRRRISVSDYFWE